MKPRLLIVDDHVILRYGMRALLEANGIDVVGESGEGCEALRLAMELDPDLIAMDVTLPGMNGIEIAKALHDRGRRSRIIFLSMHTDAEHVHRAFVAGACAYVVKGSASEQVIAAVHAVMMGHRYVSPELEWSAYSSLREHAESGPVERLSARERQVLQLVSEGKSSAKIASLIHLSPKSVDTYRSRLMKKLGVSDVTGLVKFAVRHGLTPPS